MMKIKLTFFTALLLVCAVSNAQRTYFEAEISKNIFKDFRFSLSPQIRFKEEFDLKQYFFDAGIEYKFNKFLSTAASYRLGTNITKSDNKEYFGRFAFDAKTKIKWQGFEPKFRLRYTNFTEDFDDDSSSVYNYLRYKFELEYNCSQSQFIPYIYTELFQNLTDNNLNGVRFEGGLNYKINKQNMIGGYYRVNSEFNTGMISNVIGLSYKLKL